VSENNNTIARVGRRCSIARSLEVLGEKWTILIVREAFWGRTRFSEFREALGVSSDILSDRLTTLVDGGVLERVAYRDDGARERFSYHLTESGRELKQVLAALNAWGEAHRPSEYGRSAEYREIATGQQVELAFHTRDGSVLADDEVEVVRGPAVATRP
jgi:DNA-binding HxlR family transcriptional regulator